MHITHSSIAEIVSGKLSRQTPTADPDSSQARASEARAEANCLSRILGNLMRRIVGREAMLTQEEQLIRSIRRLRALSLHLSIDIGVTHSLDDEVEVAPRHHATITMSTTGPQLALRPEPQPEPRPKHATGLLPYPQAVGN